ncbi:MAG: conserved rane protein of unknown function [Pseudonocardiales bacterium]|nr:conserved rane protein of unknown function [Pseudonocardiales bacterium]
MDVPRFGAPGERGRVCVGLVRVVRAGQSSGRRALGAIIGQFSQALASFVLQVAAAREMGAAGLAVFAVLYGAIVLATAVSAGLVGDSLTVLDRSVSALRIALVRWCLLVSATAGLVAFLIAFGSGSLTWGAALLFSLAMFTFIVEDALRRMLMATMRFWMLPAVDGTSLVFSISTLVVIHEVGGRLTIGSFMLALLVGQLAASVVAYLRLPVRERRLSPRGQAAMQDVFRYGGWRAVQLCIRPATLTAARLAITAIAGVTAYGQLEAARVYMAPALLLIGGMGSFLLPMYVAQRDEPLGRALRRADRATFAFLAVTLVGGVLATLAAPFLGEIITAGKYDLAPVAVLGWAVYAASGASLLPYTGLAAVRGQQRKLTVIRLLDPVLSLAVLVPVTFAAVNCAPYGIAVGSMLAGIAVRRWVLYPLTEAGALAARGRHRDRAH